MQKDIDQLFSSTPDLIKKEIAITTFKKIYIYYLETVSNSDSVNNYILKSLTNIKLNHNKSIKKLFSFIPGPHTKDIKKNDIEYYLTNGFTIVFTNYNYEILAIETKANLDRNVDNPNSQPSIYGPKDAFTENYQKNIGLIKRRIKTKNLKNKEFIIGKQTKTKVGLLYMENIAEEEIINSISQKLNNIDIDGIIDSGYIMKLLTDDNNTLFPIISVSERPDNTTTSLLEGKIVIMVDTSPFALICPAFFADFVNPVVDNYSKNLNSNFLKMLRFLCLIITLFTPALYIAIINYNQETLPTNLLLSFSTQRNGVPFPAIFEAYFMLIICEILRESDIRFPSSYGSAISILGALVLGDAAVTAGIVSPIMIIIISITFITSLVFTELEMINSLRFFRFLILFLASIYGIYGIALGIIFLFIDLAKTKSFNKPYSYPLAPLDFTYLNKTIFKSKINKDTKRSSLLTNKNYTKKG